jgi:2-polyprenyl-3-methyl-5-hydroxy-6-metoxy-1,4-benzoquinol methylase
VSLTTIDVEVVERCLLCGSRALVRDAHAEKELRLHSDHGVVRCAACSLRFLSPRPTWGAYFDAYVNGNGQLIETYGPLGRFYVAGDDVRKRQYEIRVERLRRFLPHGARVLEIGASSGLFLSLARAAGFSPTGLEPSDEARETARSRYGLALLPATIDEAEFEPSSFEAVVSSHVFEHLLNPLGAARKAERWLVPGGLHMLEVPNQWEALGARLRRIGAIRATPRERSFTSIHHTVFFSRQTAKALAMRSGLEPIYVRNVQYEPITVRALPKRIASAIVGGANVIELTARKASRDLGIQRPH